MRGRIVQQFFSQMKDSGKLFIIIRILIIRIVENAIPCPHRFILILQMVFAVIQSLKKQRIFAGDLIMKIFFQ